MLEGKTFFFFDGLRTPCRGEGEGGGESGLCRPFAEFGWASVRRLLAREGGRHGATQFSAPLFSFSLAADYIDFDGRCWPRRKSRDFTALLIIS